MQQQNSDSSQHLSNNIQQQEHNIKNQLKNVSYGILLKMQRSMQKHQAKQPQVKLNNKKTLIKKQQQKHDKNTPREIAIMRKPPRQQHKVIFQSQRKKGIDPRFQDYAGKYNADMANKSYSFIPQIQKQQIKEIKKTLKNKKLKSEKREILSKQYNIITSDMKRVQLQNLQIQVKRTTKKNYPYATKQRFKEAFQKAKLQRMTDQEKDKKIRKKNKHIQKLKTIQRRKLMS